MMDANTTLTAIEIVEDRTAADSCQDGFLRLQRLMIRNCYSDGSVSADYPCDIVSRPFTDAVALCLYHRDGRQVKVVLKESPRAPIYFRKLKDLVLEDPRPYLTIIELVAGLLESSDKGEQGLQKRAAQEAREEAGFTIAPENVAILGGETFASPGISDEKIYFCAAEVPGLQGGDTPGDGTAMEEYTVPVVLDLSAAIRMCRDGKIPDRKTEAGLLRLADRLGYIPQLDKFVHELPKELQSKYNKLGMEDHG